jgi:hypothetical protein|nr:hypothetical protein [uncultured Methanoregula sp.]
MTSSLNREFVQDPSLSFKTEGYQKYLLAGTGSYDPGRRKTGSVRRCQCFLRRVLSKASDEKKRKGYPCFR